MRWPWCSIARLDDARAESERRLDDAWAENARLREQINKLLDTMTRVTRREVGLPEVAREPRPRMEKMPETLQAHFLAFNNREQGRYEMGAAYKANAQGTPWETIMAKVLPQQTEE